MKIVSQQCSKFFLVDFPQILPSVPDKSNITVTWKTPFDGECPVTRYTVYYRMVERMTSAWKEVTVSSSQLQITLQLKCHKVYEIVVTARSSHGETTRNQSELVRTWGGKHFQKFSKNCSSFIVFDGQCA